jgi:DNA-binding transcriptional LysR family regulator
MLNVPRLSVLCELAARGSFSATAEALSFTQSAVSHQIAALEKEVGAKLVERDRRGARLTEAGELLRSHTEAILGQLIEAERELADYVGLRAGRLRLAAFESAGATLVPGSVAAFHERFPDVELRVVQMEPEEACESLKNRQLDLAVVYDLDPPTGILGDELELTHLFDDRYEALVPEEHGLARRRKLKLSDLAGETWINTTSQDLCHQIILRSCSEAGFQPRVAFEVDEIATSQALVGAGVGVTLLPSLALATQRADVVAKSLGADAPVRRVLAARVAKNYATPATEAMLGILQEWPGARRHEPPSVSTES